MSHTLPSLSGRPEVDVWLLSIWLNVSGQVVADCYGLDIRDIQVCRVLCALCPLFLNLALCQMRVCFFPMWSVVFSLQALLLRHYIWLLASVILFFVSNLIKLITCKLCARRISWHEPMNCWDCYHSVLLKHAVLFIHRLSSVSLCAKKKKARLLLQTIACITTLWTCLCLIPKPSPSALAVFVKVLSFPAPLAGIRAVCSWLEDAFTLSSSVQLSWCYQTCLLAENLLSYPCGHGFALWLWFKLFLMSQPSLTIKLILPVFVNGVCN